jgi:gluconate 2-dehydrogenase alpha chain
MVGAKAQPSNTLLPVVRNRTRFELRTGSWVRRILHKNGRITGVKYTDGKGTDFVQPATIVVLAGFTLNNVRLLHLSKIGTPYDPATGRGTLGRNLTHQVQGRTPVFFDKPLNSFMGAGAVVTRVSDFDGDALPAESSGLLRLGALQIGSTGDRPIATFGRMPLGTVRRNWGAEWKAASIRLVRSQQRDHIRRRTSRVAPELPRPRSDYTDKFGDPLLRFTLDWTEHEHRQREVASEVARRIAVAMGTVDASRPTRGRYDVTPYQSTHIQGGAVMGTSPETSVVTTRLQHWDVPDLWVVGASAFPQNPSHNPTLTAVAVTTWAADALIDKYLKQPGKLV